MQDSGEKAPCTLQSRRGDGLNLFEAEGMNRDSKTKMMDSLLRLEKWIEKRDYKGYEPFDGLSSFLHPLTFGNAFLERLLQQLVRQSPVNLRPFLGVRPQDSTKGRGYMARGYLGMLRLTGNPSYGKRARACLDWLDEHKAPNYEHHSWGNHFDYASRGGQLKRHEPIIVWTSLIGQAFLDACEILGDPKYMDVAISACDWIMDLPREKTNSGTCLSYVAFNQSSVHNSNMLGAAMLARTGKMTGNSAYLAVAKEAMVYSCSRQLAGGGWYYAETPEHHWIDNFHTGYNLDSLKCYIENTGDSAFEGHLDRGFEFFINHFFKDDGTPKYYHDRVYPVDIQCAAQAIETLVNFSDDDEAALRLALKVANWTLDHMQDASGYFYYRQYPLIKSKTPMLHWGQATMYRALSLFLGKMG